MSTLSPPSPIFIPIAPRINVAPIAIASVVVIAGAIYLTQTVGLRQGGLWIVGALLGISLYFASFGFTQAWRVFIADRRGAGLRAQMAMLAVGMLLFFPFLAQGSLFGNPAAGFVSPAGVSVLLGAFIFGMDIDPVCLNCSQTQKSAQ